MIFKGLGTWDRKLLFGSLMVFVAALYLLMNDSWLQRFFYADTTNLKKIGTISFLENDARRRVKTAFSWFPLYEADAVYQGDSLFTGEGSTAVIVTESGEEIRLSANTLVVFETKENALLLDIDYGSIRGSVGNNKRILISNKGEISEVRSKGGVIDLNVDRNRSLKMNVHQGQVEIKSGSAQKIVSQNQSADLTADDDKLPATIDPITPALDRKYKDNGGENKVILSWRSSPRLKKFEIEIALDPNFNTVIKRAEQKDKKFEPQDLPKNKKLFWRVKSDLKENGETKTVASPVHSFAILSDKAPEIEKKVSVTYGWEKSGDKGIVDPNLAKLKIKGKVVSPSGMTSSVSESLTDESKVLVRLQWNTDVPAEQYEIEVSADPQFTNLVQKTASDTTYAQLQLPEGNRYYVRVRNLNFKDSSWSKPQAINTETLGTLPSPDLGADKVFALKPKPKTLERMIASNTKDEKRSSAIQNPPTLKWKRLDDGAKYIVELADDPDFQKNLLRFGLDEARWTWKNPKLGTFFVRARVILASKQSRFSKPVQIKISEAPPTPTSKAYFRESVNSLKELEQTTANLKVQWQAQIYAKNYELIWAKSKDFNDAKKIITPALNAFLPVQSSGLYHWKVRGLASNGEAVSDFSGPHKLQVDRIYRDDDLEKKLQLTSPQGEDSIIFVTKDKSRIKYTWTTPFPEANHKLQLSQEESFDEVKEHLSKGNSLLVESTMASGWWHARLRVESSGYASAWTAPIKFLINYSLEPYIPTSNPLTLVSTPKLPPPILFDVNPLPPGRFIASIAELPAPEVEPSHSPFLVKQKTPTLDPNIRWSELPLEKHFKEVTDFPQFNWQTVNGATNYRVEIAFDSRFENRSLTKSLKAPGFTWTQFQVGRHFWRVSSQDSKSRQETFSKPQVLEIVLSPPKKLCGDQFESQLTEEADKKKKSLIHQFYPVQLKWTPILFARFYEVELGPTEDFQQKRSIIMSSHNDLLPVPQLGKHFWRVRALDGSKRPLTDFSETYQFDLNSKTP